MLVTSEGNTKESEIKNIIKINGEILDLEYFEKDSSQNELRFPRLHFSSGNTSIFICPTGLLILDWAVLSEEQMSIGYPFSLLNDEQMSNKVGVEHQPVDSCGIQGLWVHSNGSNDWNFTPPLRGKARLFLDTAA